MPGGELPGDRERFADYEVALAQELAALAVDTTRERDWGMLESARIEFETADDLEVGRFRLSSRVEADEQERDYAAGPAGPAAAQPVHDSRFLHLAWQVNPRA